MDSSSGYSCYLLYTSMKKKWILKLMELRVISYTYIHERAHLIPNEVLSISKLSTYLKKVSLALW